MKEKSKNLSYEKPVLTRLDEAAQGIANVCAKGSIAAQCPKGGKALPG